MQFKVQQYSALKKVHQLNQNEGVQFKCTIKKRTKEWVPQTEQCQTGSTVILFN